MMKKTLAAIAIATSLAGGAAFAQSTAGTMDVGLSMLELSVAKEFNEIGIEGVDPMSLSLSQLAEIKNVIGSPDRNNAEMKAQIETIISR